MSQSVSAKPMYQKIRERLERDISGGRYAAGEKFPSEAALVGRFGASRITVGRAVRELQERGLLDRVAGSGTYVRGTGPQPISAKPMYQKIRERLERDISGGRYAAGEKFPSEAALVERFGASRITVGRAVRE